MEAGSFSDTLSYDCDIPRQYGLSNESSAVIKSLIMTDFYTLDAEGAAAERMKPTFFLQSQFYNSYSTKYCINVTAKLTDKTQT